MKFRCPYCKQELESLASAKCPKCGRVMAVKRQSDASDRRERRKKIERIRSDAARMKREIGAGAPMVRKGPLFYLVMVAGFSAILFVAVNFSTVPQFADGKIADTVKNVELLAEAAGRFRFHTGSFPTTEQGLEALTWTQTGKVPGYDGPYLMNRNVPSDRWKRPFVYEFPSPGEAAVSNAVPTLLSMGPDGVRGTADDIVASAESFWKATKDVSWTNEWVSYSKRGITILSKAQKEAVLKAERLAKEREAKLQEEAGAGAGEGK